MKYPGSLHLTVKRAVEDAIEAVKAKHPRYVGDEMEIVFLPREHVGTVNLRNTLQFRQTDTPVVLGGELDECPEPAHAAAEEDSDGA